VTGALQDRRGGAGAADGRKPRPERPWPCARTRCNERCRRPTAEAGRALSRRQQCCSPLQRAQRRRAPLHMGGEAAGSRRVRAAAGLVCRDVQSIKYKVRAAAGLVCRDEVRGRYAHGRRVLRRGFIVRTGWFHSSLASSTFLRNSINDNDQRCPEGVLRFGLPSWLVVGYAVTHELRATRRAQNCENYLFGAQ